MILSALYYIGAWLVGIIADAASLLQVPAGVANNIGYLFEISAGWNAYIPILHLYTILAFIFTFEVIVLSFNIIIGIVALIRGSGKPEV